MAGRLHIKNHRIIYRIIADPLYELVRLSPCLLRVDGIGVQINSRSETRRVRTAHIRVKIRVNARVRAARLDKDKGYPRGGHLTPVNTQIVLGHVNTPGNGTASSHRLHFKPRRKCQRSRQTQRGHLPDSSFKSM